MAFKMKMTPGIASSVLRQALSRDGSDLTFQSHMKHRHNDTFAHIHTDALEKASFDSGETARLSLEVRGKESSVEFHNDQENIFSTANKITHFGSVLPFLLCVCMCMCACVCWCVQGYRFKIHRNHLTILYLFAYLLTLYIKHDP